MKRILLAILFLLPVTAHADGEIKDEKELCRVLQTHNNKGAEYVPGVDMRGKSVVPADTASTSGFMNNPIVIPITIDLAQRYGLALPSGVKLKPDVASLKIYDDGRIAYNDQDITKKVVTSCDKPEETAPPPANNAKSNGQKAADAVVSGDKIEGQYPEYNE
jgi:hypothetical protein